jgi:hypothetical protein
MFISRNKELNMNIRQITSTIKLIQTSKPTLGLKIAVRWLQALNMKHEYDIMMRLQTLEGAAGVPVNTWWREGSSALPKAKAWFADKQYPIDPEWLSPAYTNTYGIVESQVAAQIKRYGLSEEPLDYINNALMGQGIHADTDTMYVAYAAGKGRAERILSGKESPVSMAKGSLGMFFRNRVDRDKKNIKRPEQFNINDEGQIQEFETPTSDTEAADYLLELLTSSYDPIGQKIRNLMRETWKGENYEDVMNEWVDILEETGNIPRKSEFVEIYNQAHPEVEPQLSSTNFSNNYWKKSLVKFYKRLWNTPAILNLLAKKYLAEGVPFFQEKPDINQLISLGAKVASIYRFLKRMG